MSARRLASAFALLVVLVPASEALAEQNGPMAHKGPEKPATRADVLAGRATRAQTIELLKASVETAGGSTIPMESDPSSPPPPIGGYAYPVLAIDLDGDSDDETILLQYSDRQYLVAVDDGEILWRFAHPDDTELIGVLPADFSAGGGKEAVLVGFEWGMDGPVSARLDVFGYDGASWSYTTTMDWFELNGLVQADGDPEDEIAITIWNGTQPVSIYVIDSTGGPARLVRPSLEETLARSMSSEVFVTDGPGSGPDEAVFVTPLVSGYYAERRSLADGLQTAFDVKVNAEVPSFFQGPDYTGDGRRDAFISEYSGGPLEFAVTYGVFNAAGFATEWTQTTQEEFFYFDFPYHPGDADGDGGQDLCFDQSSYDFDDEETSSVTVRCLSGATGTELWKASRTITGENAYASALTWGDLDADGVIDPILVSETYTCSEEDWWCGTTSFEATALNGANGSTIWATDDVEASDVVWDLSNANVDGTPGDDMIGYPYDEEEPPDAPFAVHSGLTLEDVWGGVIDTGENPGYVSSAMETDLDGDGSAEAIITAEAYEETDRVVCYEFFGEEFCYNEWEEFAYVAAYEPGGEFLWQLEL